MSRIKTQLTLAENLLEDTEKQQEASGLMNTLSHVS